ncbi:MAG: hypothetical protein J6A98_00790 [Clostridia bacterium]|nr:hypothetical protein [Clostridia bacterium]
MNAQGMINTFMQMSRTGGNPQQIAQQMLANDPQARQIFQQMQNMANGLTPRDFAIQYAQQNGVNPNEFLQFAKQFGLN